MNASRARRWVWQSGLRMRRMLFAITGLVALGACASIAEGAMLSDLLNGDSLDVGHARFSDWQLLSLNAEGTEPDLAQISVLPLAGDPAKPGIQFLGDGQLAIAGLDSIDLLFAYRVSRIGPSPAFSGQSLEITGVAGPIGIAYVSQEATDGVGGDLGSALTIADFTTNVLQLSDDGAFAPQGSLVVTTNVFVTGVSGNSAVALHSFTQHFVQVPEPSGLLLALAGFVVVGIRFRTAKVARDERAVQGTALPHLADSHSSERRVRRPQNKWAI